jgi:hypothetical protein
VFACVGVVAVSTERNACLRCLEFEEEIPLLQQRLAALGYT